MIKSLNALFVGFLVVAAAWGLSSEASAANCDFNRNEKISMVSWIIPIAGAVITPMACRRDMFNKGNRKKNRAAEPSREPAQSDATPVDRRRQKAM